VVLALVLYQEIKKVPEEHEPRVIEIARAIGRTPDSVVYKIANLRFLVTGGQRGLKHVGGTDRKVWAEFKGRDPELKREADQILHRSSLTPETEFEHIQDIARGQGFLQSAVDRRRVEEVAMAQARRHFSDLGYQVVDVHSEMPYDLRCVKANEEFFVEVKGTTGKGKSVMLTGGEVRFAKKHPGRMALFVTRSIRLGGDDDMNSGTKVVLKPWLLDDSKLAGSSYLYEL